MALLDETKRITAQFEYSDDDVNKGVQEFLRQMSMYCILDCRVTILLRRY